MRKIKIFFIITILVLMILPIIFFNSKKTISEIENRALAEKPILIKNNHINFKFFTELNDFFQDHLGFRDQLIYLDSNIPLKIKSPVNVEKAIIGKNGWYFYTNPTDGNNLMDFYKRNLFEPLQVNQFEEKIKKTVNWCNEHGIQCLFLIGPNKHSIYEEFYPFDRPEGITRADQIVQIFEKNGFHYIFPRDFLISKKSLYEYPLYSQTDTHWNSQGAYLTSLLLKDELSSIFPNVSFPSIEYEVSISETETEGDLLPMLNIQKSKSTEVQVTPIVNNLSGYYRYIDDDTCLHTKGVEETLPRALIYRDSFFIALEPFISPLFSETEYHWKKFNESDKEYVLNYKPDIIIFETVERTAQYIIEK